MCDTLYVDRNYYLISHALITVIFFFILNKSQIFRYNTKLPIQQETLNDYFKSVNCCYRKKCLSLSSSKKIALYKTILLCCHLKNIKVNARRAHGKDRNFKTHIKCVF